MFVKSEYKGNPILVLKRDENDKFPFSFGLTKAKLILENIEAIKQFVDECSQEKAGENIVPGLGKDDEQ